MRTKSPFLGQFLSCTRAYFWMNGKMGIAIMVKKQFEVEWQVAATFSRPVFLHIDQ
jgi:hypothetical protein